MTRMPVVSGKEMVRFLQRRGFSVTRIRGSHHHLEKEEYHTVVPVHGNKALKRGTLQGILADIEMSTNDFLRLRR